MDNRVSVIIPCYNGEGTIDRAICSVYEQDYQNIELIVVDDGSTDNSKEKILVWKKKLDSNCRNLIYIYQENQGPGGAINKGLKYVTGDFLMLLDADDEYLSGAISEKINYFALHPECNIVRSNGWIVKNGQKYLFVYNEKEKEQTNIFLSLLRGETNNWAGSYMVRTAPLFKFYPDREIYASRFGQNLQIILPVAYNGSCGFIDKPLMNYIRQENSLSQTSDEQTAKKKALENAAGFRNIREHMVKQIVCDKEKQSKYLQNVKGAYWRGIMQIAAQFKDRSLLLKAKKKLIQYETMQFQDKVLYYNTLCPPIALLLRVCHKIGRKRCKRY